MKYDDCRQLCDGEYFLRLQKLRFSLQADGIPDEWLEEFIPAVGILQLMIDYRSDTVTRPTRAMLESMMQAEVADDVFGEDPSVNQLEKMAASIFGMDAALFCPSGTMTNQVAIKCHTQPGDEVICEGGSHIYQYEGGGIGFHSGASAKLIQGDRGRITAEQVLESVNADDVHKARTSLVSLENTANRGGGSCYSSGEIRRIREVCIAHGLRLHLDGARLFNALVAREEDPREYGSLFDSISICLSKSLGCPVGSLLIGSLDFIRRSRRIRKVMGGGMRQAGYLAAAGIYALENNIDRLRQDHEHARALAAVFSEKSFVREVLPAETNILIFSVSGAYTASGLVEKLKENGILSYAISSTQVRLVTHLDITPSMVDQTIELVRKL